jgi:hypothetical protein
MDEQHQPKVLYLTHELGETLAGAMNSIQSRDLLTILQSLSATGESYRALSSEVNALAERILHKVVLEDQHRDSASALATTMLAEDLDALNAFLGEIRMRSLSTPEEAHLVLVALLELLGFQARLLADRGEDPRALLRQAIAARNSALDSLS